ncbi:zinc-ribbon domain-containing protein [Companilactobacillus jidongensis]|uniref:zinc-ribbon domain-containing protein n=1 Tax=Companilactobacillus jidongensis TaxID=2486006 RepID=UPI000F77D719|nr:zinc ribbon domain-containing protein [Companilactobacillus jidongensis]
MFCSKCGYKVENGVKFCPKCGQNLLTKKPVKENNTTEKITIIKKYGHNKKVIIALTAVIIVLIAYWVVYVPMTVNSVLSRENFTSQNDYKVTTNPVTKTIEINAGEKGVYDIERGLNSSHFDTSPIAIEYRLNSVAQAISSKTLGNWKISLTQSKYKDTAHLLWQFTGKSETHRYQNTSDCRKQHQLWVQRDENTAENDQKNNSDANTAGGLLGLFF